MAAGPLRERLAEPRPLVLDGATGTELERRGVRAALPLWSAHALLECPEVVGRIHADYVAAGADLLTANSFRTQRRTLLRAGQAERAAELTGRAVALAREAAAAADRPVWVLGSAPPLEDCFRPELVPGELALAREHAEHAEHLASAGVDAVLVETMNTAREAAAAARAARAVGLPAIVCFTCRAGPRLPSGEPLSAALEAVRAESPLAVGVNCLAPSRVTECLPILSGESTHYCVYANLGEPRRDGDASSGWTEELSPEAFADAASRWILAGAAIVGGCCGTSPAHVRALATRVKNGPLLTQTGRSG